ncbi:hypothetical protein RND71_025287 [Anisodus tanguticus]|uniref:Uncharacterized protein n=1 Tax=Anisodus tanguticus TaxID=243964 RepID=A0AAE1RSN6_9SOLA|nr:hypothetical protein RND71_025287 [Anisodus tanguticus]
MINTNNCTSPPTVEEFLVPPKWIPFETKAAYRRHKAWWLVESSQKNVSGVSDLYRTGVTIKGLFVTVTSSKFNSGRVVSPGRVSSRSGRNFQKQNSFQNYKFRIR